MNVTRSPHSSHPICRCRKFVRIKKNTIFQVRREPKVVVAVSVRRGYHKACTHQSDTKCSKHNTDFTIDPLQFLTVQYDPVFEPLW